MEVPLRLVAEDHWAWERQRDRERSRQRRLEERQKEREQQERQEQATGRQLGRLSAGGAAGSSGGAAGGAASSKRGNAAAAIAVAAGGGAGTGAGGIRGSGSGRVVGGAGGAGGGGGVVPPRGAPLVGGRPAPSVTVIALRPPVAVMNSRWVRGRANCQGWRSVVAEWDQGHQGGGFIGGNQNQTRSKGKVRCRPHHKLLETLRSL